MPRFDYLCPAGHLHESLEDRETTAIGCTDCGATATRTIVAGHLPGISGFTPKPTREHYVRLGQAMEAQHEIIDACERAHIEPPDLLGMARARIKRGDAVAVEG